MGLLNGQLTSRRFRVDGELPENFRDVYRDRLNEFAFREPPYKSKEASEGWVHIDEMMNTSFENFNRWLIGEYVLVALRIDQIRLPAKRFKAELKRRTQEWCTEREIERCPAAVRSEIKQVLEDEWLAQSMPTTKMVGFCWNLTTNVLYIESQSEGVCDQIRKRFFRTFGRRMSLLSPLVWVEDDEDLVGQMIGTPPMSTGIQ